LNFIYYIAASIVSHLLIIGFLYLTPPFKDTGPDVFKVDIVAPEGINKLPEPAPVRPAVKKTTPPLSKRRPSPPAKELPPETLYGRGRGEFEQDAGKSSNNSKSSGTAKAPASGKGDGKSLPSAPEEKGTAQPGENGFALTPRSQLFDEKTIEKYAREGSIPKKGLTFDTSEFRHRGYMRMLKERIESIWQYPREAARQGLSGELYMKFSIKKDGRLGEIELLRTSGFKDLDEAAIKAVKKAEPFWPLPEDWGRDTLEIRGHFIYIYGDTLVL
jgi:protein TonB